MSRKQQGMSVLELMISIGLTAVLMGLAVPSMGQLIATQRISAATNQMIAHLQYARLQAVTRKLDVIACPSVDRRVCSGNRWDRGWMIFSDKNGNGRPDTDRDLLRVIQVDERATIASGGRFRVRFQPTGGAYGTNLTLKICSSDQAVEGRAVIVSNPGRVRFERRLPRAECHG